MAADPTLANDVSGLNQAQSDYQTQSKALSDQLNQFTAGQQQTISGAYQNAAQQTGLKEYQDTYNSLDNAYIKAQSQANAAPVNAVLDSAGHDVMSSTAAAAGTANALVPGLTASNTALAMAPAENALNTAMTNTQNIAGNIVTGAQLAEQGFSAGMDAQLRALQSKIDSQQILTGYEYNAYVGLTTAKTQAAAQVQSAQIGAGATVQAANISAAAQKAIAAYNNPGISIKTDANGNYAGSSYLNSPNTPAGVTTPSGVELNSLKQQYAAQMAANPSYFLSGNDGSIITNIEKQTGLSQPASATLFYSLRKPYEAATSTASSQPQPQPRPGPSPTPGVAYGGG